MSVQQIPAILKSISPQFRNQDAIKITSSEFAMMKDVIQEYCRTYDAPRLYGMLGRIGRRMKQANTPHLWQTEFEYFASSMMQSLKDKKYCRLEDTIDDINEIFMRVNKSSLPGRNRSKDKSQILSIFG
ncbi:hypothetical protein [Aliikangiella sp. IMCC44359]|uniref:hypothetical protein n=1 Tax=Aliikangiella sp. IMCC44359 TaxID=3459125 RepID=UPI00403A8092